MKRSRGSSLYSKNLFSATSPSPPQALPPAIPLRIERRACRTVLAVPNARETAEGAEIVWQKCYGDLDIYITPDGHCVRLCSVLETGF